MEAIRATSMEPAYFSTYRSPKLIGIDVFLFNVDVMIFGKARLSIVQSIRG